MINLGSKRNSTYSIQYSIESSYYFSVRGGHLTKALKMAFYCQDILPLPIAAPFKFLIVRYALQLKKALIYSSSQIKPQIY